MTKEYADMLEANLRKAYDTANATENAYRVAKAQKFLQLSFPTDGSKKPTEAVILSTIDADENITALRVANQKAQAELDVQKMVCKLATSVY